jgi:hypothetical protein
MKFLHLRKKKHGKALPHGGVTVAYQYPEGSDNVIKIAIAQCSDRDNFSRRRGRQISEGRWQQAFVNGEMTKHVRIIPLFNQKPIEAIVANLK